jgi:hypothetical protein
MNEKLTNEELSSVISEMLTHMNSVADLVDNVFPDKKAGADLKQSANKLCAHVNAITEGVESAKEQPSDAAPANMVEELLAIAAKDCKATFKALEELKALQNYDDLLIKKYDVLSNHARELLDTIVLR